MKACICLYTKATHQDTCKSTRCRQTIEPMLARNAAEATATCKAEENAETQLEPWLGSSLAKGA
jgi:hypothetical protein